jgi:hypothetical protein
MVYRKVYTEISKICSQGTVLRRKLFLSGLVLFALLCFSVVPFAGAASMWSRTYGGTGDDVALSAIETSDGGYAITGYTDGDFLLLKTDAFGSLQWNRTYGGTDFDVACSVISTSDGGYALAGSIGLWNDTGDGDFWLVKTDALGNMDWNRTYNGKRDDVACSVVATSDGGYAIAGTTNADYSSLYAQDTDFWLVKTDALGNMLWNKTYGGPKDDAAYSLVATSDGGYALAGETMSFGAGINDFWLVKTDALGNMQWNKTYGGTDIEVAFALALASDGGYALAGYYLTTQGPPATADFWLVKTDALGNMMWNKTYDRSWDEAYSLVATRDGGYAIAGKTESPSQNDFWLIKTDAFGNAEWNQTYEGSSLGGGIFSWACSLIATSDGGYAIASYTGFTGNIDIRFVKTDENGNISTPTPTSSSLTPELTPIGASSPSPSPPIPEFSEWVTSSLVLVVSVLILFYRKRLLRARS